MDHIKPTHRVAVFIDGSNLYQTSRNLGFDVDYKNLREYLAKKMDLVRVYYYAAMVTGESYSPLKPLIDWLAYNNYTVVTKPAREYTDANGKRRIRATMNVEIAVDMLNIANFVDHVILFSGDGDYRRVVEAVMERGTKVTVVASIKSNVSDDLRRQADYFVDLKDIYKEFQRGEDRPVSNNNYDVAEDDEAEILEDNRGLARTLAIGVPRK